MNKLKIVFATFIISLVQLSPSTLHAASEPKVLVTATPLVQRVSAGEIFEVAVVFTMMEGWHIYWKNPGDAGIPTSFEWRLPLGYELLKHNEPVPRRHVEEGITTFIHEDQAIYLFQIKAPETVQDTSHFQLFVDWLECKSICQAGAASLQFSLPQEADLAMWERLRASAITRFPEEPSHGIWKTRLSRKHITLKRASKNSMDTKLVSADFFPLTEMIYDIAKPVVVKRGFRNQLIRIPLLDSAHGEFTSVQGILVQHLDTPEGVIINSIMINENLVP